MTQRVLLVDDDPTIRGLFSYILNTNGYAVDERPNADEGIAYLETQKPDIVVTDWKTESEFNGIDLVQQARTKGVPRVVLMSSHPDVDQAAAGLNGNGPHRVFEKITGMRGLLKAVEE